MPISTQTRLSPYSPAELYAMVMDVEAYPTFLPWCAAARILTREENCMFADLVIRFKGLQEKYTSKITFDPEHYSIDVEMTSGPFTHLINNWRFTPEVDGKTLITFHIDFAFRSQLLNKLIGGLFTHALEKMIEAFERRAEAIFGK